MADHGEVKLRDTKIQALIDLYHETYSNIVETIITDTTAGRIQKARTMAAIKAQLQDLGDNVDAWVQKEIPQYYLDGANIAIQDLKSMGVDLSGPKGLAPINKAAIASLLDDTSLAFAQSLTAISRNAQAILGNAVKQQLNFIIADGQLTGAARDTVAASVKQFIADNGIAALTDAGGKDWQFDTYAQMLVRTKAVEARNAGLQNKMLQNGYDLVQVSDHNSDHPACADWEGQILSITGSTDGYATTDEAEADGLMHPNCEHAYNVIDPELAALTSSYSDAYDYGAAAADDSDFPESTGAGKTQEFSVYHGSGGNVMAKDVNMMGNGYYVARTPETAANFGNVASSTMAIKQSEILVLHDQAEYNNFMQKAIAFKPGDNQAAMPAYAQSLGYKAIEVTSEFDPLGGINVLDKSTLLNTTRPYDELQSAIEKARNAGDMELARKLADELPIEMSAGMGLDVVKTTRHLEVDPKTGKVVVKL